MEYAAAPSFPFRRPDPLRLAFEGFSERAFALLDDLRLHPTVAHLRTIKSEVDEHVVQPFGRYRDDLAVNWVLPNGLPFETEKRVFSRLQKNDFGKGGAHHHLWLAFYRPPRKRLTDIQLSHSLYPDRFTVGLYMGDYAKGLFGPAKDRMLARPGEALGLLNPLLERGYTFSYARGVTKRDAPDLAHPLGALPDDFAKAKGVWVRKAFPKADVLRWGPDLVAHALDELDALWPLYRFWLDASDESLGQGPPPGAIG
jgi:hypothetical protein